MKSSLQFLILLILAVSGRSSRASDPSLASVVYLRQNVIKTVEQDGQMYQLWLKLPDQKTARPFFDTRSGTGLFISIDNKPYLVTASHVARQMTSSALAVIRGPNDKPVAIVLSDFVAPQTNLNWTIHAQADVAVLPITTTNLLVRKTLAKHFLRIDVFVSDHSSPDRDLDLTILGFPLNLGVEGNFSPISRTSRAASGLLSLPRADTKTKATFFLLQDPSVGGFSGAPVFLKPGTFMKGTSVDVRRSFQYLGLVHGTISDKTGGKFAAVTPAEFILEALRQAHKASGSEKETGQQPPERDK